MKPKLLLVMACGLLAACGPTIPIDAGLKTSGADILFGRPPASPAPPPIVAPLVPGFPAPIEMPPLPPLPVPPTPPPPACPSASPLDYPALQAPVTPPAPPVAATYAFRYTGTDTIDPGKADQKIVLENGNGTRQVTNVQTIPAANAAQAPHYTFDVIETYQGWQQTNSYDIEPSGPSQASAVGTSPAAGIYLTRMTIQPTGAGQRSPQDFRPSTPVQISTFPEAPGATFEGGGSDGSTTMEITPNTVDPNSGIVKGRVNVDACGTVLQSWQNLLDGRIVTTAGPGPQEVFALELDFGTQYGGLSLQDHLVLDTTPQTGLPDHLDLTTTINEEPQVPQP